MKALASAVKKQHDGEAGNKGQAGGGSAKVAVGGDSSG